MAKKEYTGDGLSFYSFVKKNRKSIGEMLALLNISNGTLYNYYDSHELEPEVKKKIADAFKTTEVAIFGDNMEKSPSRIRDEAYPLGAHNDDDPKEESRGKQYIDLGNGFYHLYVPLVHQYAYGGYLKGYADPEWMEELPVISFTVDRVPRGVYRAFKVRGDSMDDDSKKAIAEGDTVLGRVIEQELYRNAKLHLHKYKNFIIVHREGIMIKQITEHDVQNGLIHIHSLNPDKVEYPDTTVDLRDVLQILNVIKVSRDI